MAWSDGEAAANCSRGMAGSLVAMQFLTMIIAMIYTPEKHPLFLYTTSVSYADAATCYNTSSYTMWFAHDGYRQQSAVNPYLKAADAPHPPAFAQNPPFSRTHMMVVATFALFMIPAFLGVVYSFNSVRLVDTGQISIEAVYGEHGVKESIMWEATFWTLVCIQHVVVQCVLSSPADLIYVVGTSFAVSVLLLAFCVLAANAEGDAASRRFEGPVFILICLVYLLIVTQSKIVLSQQFTFVMWLAHVMTNAMLVMGHLWDNPVTCQTVLNCRWAYVVISCWFNVCLYVAY